MTVIGFQKSLDWGWVGGVRPIQVFFDQGLSDYTKTKIFSLDYYKMIILPSTTKCFTYA